MSLTVLTVMLIFITIYGVPVREPDEGTGVHLFQIWLALEVLAVIFFAFTWLPKAPKHAVFILVLQVGAALLPMSIVFFLNL